MKYLQKQQLLEQIIYATMWILILGTPLIGLLLDDEHPLEMSQIGKEITDTWLHGPSLLSPVHSSTITC